MAVPTDFVNLTDLPESEYLDDLAIAVESSDPTQSTKHMQLSKITKKTRTDSASQLGGVYEKDYETGDTIPADAMKDKLMYWHNGQLYSVGTDAGFKSNDFDVDLAAGRFVSAEIATKRSLSTVKLSDFDIKERDASETKKIIDVFNNHESVIMDGEYWVSNDKLDSAAKLSRLIIDNNSTLRLENNEFNFDLLNKDLIIDLMGGGIIHGGRRGCILSRDHVAGEKVLDVVDASDLIVGQHLSTSMAFEATDAEAYWWNNDIRTPADKYNTITAIDYAQNKVTVENGVPNCKFPKNTYLQNARFARNGLMFSGSGNVTILGGKIIESSGGCYLSGIQGFEADIKPLHITVDAGTEFTGQSLDAFLLRGEEVNLTMNDFSVKGGYDNAKQTFVTDGGANITLSKGYINRGLYDAELYVRPSTQKKMGLMYTDNVIFDGKSTLLVKPGQEWEDGSGTLDNTWHDIGDCIHVTQWKAPRPVVTEGIISKNTKFLNYRRAVAGSTASPMNDNLTVNNISFDNCEMDCPPYYFSIGPGATLYIPKSIKLHNTRITAKYADPYYLLGYTGGNGTRLIKPTSWTGSNSLRITNDTLVSHNATINGRAEEFVFQGESGLAVQLFGSNMYVDRVIADNVIVRKRDSGQGSNVIETIAIFNGSFLGDWVSETPPQWNNDNLLLRNDTEGTAYAGMATKSFYRTDPNDFIPLCKLTPLSGDNASCQIDINTAHTYGGAAKVNGSFYISLPTDGTPITATEKPNAGVILVANGADVAYPITDIFLENKGIPSDLSAFVFKCEDGVLSIKILGTKPLGSFVTIRGNVVGLV